MNTFDKSRYGLVTVSLGTLFLKKMKQMVSGTPDEPSRRTKVSRNMLSRFLDTTFTRTWKHNNKLYRNQQCARCYGCLAPVRKELQTLCSMLVRTQFIFWVQHSRFNRKHWMTFATNRKPWLEMLLGLTVIGSNHQHIVSVRQGIIPVCILSVLWLHGSTKSAKGSTDELEQQSYIYYERLWEYVMCFCLQAVCGLMNIWLAWPGGQAIASKSSFEFSTTTQYNETWFCRKKHVTSVRDHSWTSTICPLAGFSEATTLSQHSCFIKGIQHMYGVKMCKV